MFSRLSDRAQKVLALSQSEAARFNHHEVRGEHVLLGLISEGSGVGVHVLTNLSIDLSSARAEIENQIPSGHKTSEARGPSPIAPASAVITAAIEEARDLGHNYVGTEHLLLAVLRERDSVAALVLKKLGVTLERARVEVLSLLGAVDQSRPAAAPSDPDCPMCRVLTGVARTPAFIAELGWTVAVLGTNQGCPGWCVLILKEHHEHLAELPSVRQASIWRDVSVVAAAIRQAFPTSGKDGGPPRINYECLGNQVAHIHWHVIPRHADDPEPTKPVWGRSEAALRGTMSDEERQRLAVRLGLLLAPPSGA
jgi:diadenosine tetraphosphate (Ap4A) HIT family hydrolase